MLSLVLALFLLHIFRIPVFATQEFNLIHHITYEIQSNGNGSVSHKVKLVNNISQIYAKEYHLQLSGTNISNLTSTDETGDILDRIQSENDATHVYLQFQKPAIGKNQAKEFNLNYIITQMAIQKGNIWELSLPQFTSLKDNDQINIDIKIPQSFGKVSFSSIPIKNSVEYLGQHTQIKLSGQQIKNKKILLILGNYQLFDFSLSYYLKNDSSQAIQSKIPLPPDTGSQKIVFRQITPKPSNVEIDPDGNWLAYYQLEPNQEIEISVKGQAKIISSIQPTSGIDHATLTSPTDFWPAKDPSIIQISQPLEQVEDIYNYVVTTLDYDYNQIGKSTRKGALLALQTAAQSLCTEFTDLFIAIARSKGIPSREIEGYAYTNNPKIKPINTNADILHAWPQYYNTNLQSWVSIDPTWGKTTNGIDYFNDLDLNHLIFVIHGKDSQNPPPPGSYKRSPSDKSISVSFATNELTASNLPLTVVPVKQGINQPPKVIINNPNPNQINDIHISIPQTKHTVNYSSMPPFSHIEIDTGKIPFLSSLLPKNQKLTININSQQNVSSNSQTIVYHPHYVNLIIAIVTSMIALSISGIILTAKSKQL